jgi:hypothetical protein
MGIKIGDKIRYVAASEDGEVVGASELSPGCVARRRGASANPRDPSVMLAFAVQLRGRGARSRSAATQKTLLPEQSLRP